MKTSVGTMVTFANKERFAIIDIATIGDKEYAYALLDDGNVKNPQVSFFTETIKDGKVFLYPVTDVAEFKNLLKKFKLRMSV